MGNISIQRVCMDTLVNFIVTNIPALAGKVSSVTAGPQEFANCLAVKILMDQLTFDPSSSDEVYEADPDDGKVVVDVGCFYGLITLQLFTNSPAEREEYEQKIIDLFLRTVWSPGTAFLATPNLIINGYNSLYSSELRARLDSTQWEDELAFENKRYSFIEITIDYPALTTYDAANLKSLQVCLSDTGKPVATLADIDSGNRVEVQEDGSTLPGTL